MAVGLAQQPTKRMPWDCQGIAKVRTAYVPNPSQLRPTDRERAEHRPVGVYLGSSLCRFAVLTTVGPFNGYSHAVSHVQVADSNIHKHTR